MFGDNENGNLGNDEEYCLRPQLIESFVEAASHGVKVASIEVGDGHTLSMMDMSLEVDQKCGVFVWGSNLFSQLGLKENREKVVSIPLVLENEGFEKGLSCIKAHSSYSAAVDREGKVSGVGNR